MLPSPHPFNERVRGIPPTKQKTNIMNYRFINTARRVNEIDTNAAAVITGAKNILSYSRCIGEYVFTKDEELTNELNKAKSIEIVRKVSSSGIVSYRAEIVTDNGKYIARLYGAGKGATYAERSLTADEIKKAVFGLCTSDGEVVTELKTDGQKAVKVPVIYLNTAE